MNPYFIIQGLRNPLWMFWWPSHIPGHYTTESFFWWWETWIQGRIADYQMWIIVTRATATRDDVMVSLETSGLLTLPNKCLCGSFDQCNIFLFLCPSPVTTWSPLKANHQMDHDSDTHRQQPNLSEEKSGHVEDESLLPDRKETRRLLLKIDLRIIPFIALLYICSFLDRVNIANAKVAGLVEDLGMSDDLYNWAVSIFFISYVSWMRWFNIFLGGFFNEHFNQLPRNMNNVWYQVIADVPSNLMLKFVGPRRWIAAIMITWGTITAAMAAVKNGSGLLAARFFLGLAEAGLYPVCRTFGWSDYKFNNRVNRLLSICYQYGIQEEYKVYVQHWLQVQHLILQE